MRFLSENWDPMRWVSWTYLEFRSTGYMTVIRIRIFTLDYCLRIWSITMTSSWAQWRLKSPASRLFTQLFIQSADQRENQSSESVAFVRRTHWWPVNSPHKGPVTRKMFLFDDVITLTLISVLYLLDSLRPDEAYIDGLVQDCSISSTLAMEILLFCTKPLLWEFGHH